jgi:polyhydroxyalkanoate synthase
VLLVPSLINRSYIFDLHPSNSMVELLLAAGLDVFIIDWGEAEPADAENTLETYVDSELPAAVEAAVRAAGTDDLTLVGYCLGGFLALLYAAGHPDSRVHAFVSLATPVDFEEMGLLVAMVREGRLEIDEVLDEDGNVPGSTIRRMVSLRRPTGNLVQYANLLENLWRDDYMAGYQAMSRWVRESVPVPGALAHQMVDRFVRNNELMSGEVALGGRAIKLASLTAPCLVALAEQDDMVPLASAAPLTQLLEGARVDELRVPGGHIALAVGRRAMTNTIPRIIDWVRDNSDPIAAPSGAAGRADKE